MLLVCGSAAFAIIASETARADDAVIARPTRAPALNPVTLLREAITALLPAAQDADLAKLAYRADALELDFASGNERVSLSLAESQVSVRLGEELRLHCEVSSIDEMDSDPELGIDVGLRFKFK